MASTKKEFVSLCISDKKLTSIGIDFLCYYTSLSFKEIMEISEKDAKKIILETDETKLSKFMKSYKESVLLLPCINDFSDDGMARYALLALYKSQFFNTKGKINKEGLEFFSKSGMSRNSLKKLNISSGEIINLIYMCIDSALKTRHDSLIKYSKEVKESLLKVILNSGKEEK
jgi:hypothetical protein